jgi:hypothetical protein
VKTFSSVVLPVSSTFHSIRHQAPAVYVAVVFVDSAEMSSRRTNWPVELIRSCAWLVPDERTRSSVVNVVGIVSSHQYRRIHRCDCAVPRSCRAESLVTTPSESSFIDRVPTLACVVENVGLFVNVL